MLATVLKQKSVFGEEAVQKLMLEEEALEKLVSEEEASQVTQSMKRIMVLQNDTRKGILNHDETCSILGHQDSRYYRTLVREKPEIVKSRGYRLEWRHSNPMRSGKSELSEEV